MNEELFKLAWRSLKRRRKSSVLLLAVLMLSFAFAVMTMSLSGSITKTNEAFRVSTYGPWHYLMPFGEERDEEFLKSQPWLDGMAVCTRTGVLGFEDEDGSIAPTAFSVGTADKNFKSSIALLDGRFPSKKGEIALEAKVLNALGLDYTIGQPIGAVVFLSEDEEAPVMQTFTLCGVIKAYTDLWEYTPEPSNAPSAVFNSAIITEDMADSLFAMAEDQGFSPAGKDGRQYFLLAKDGMKKKLRTAVKEYQQEMGRKWPYVYSNSAGKSAAEEESGYNTVYVALIFLITLFAILCIYALQLQKQVRQFALFRSIGITKSQLRKMVFFETVLLALPAAALGTGLGAAGVWAALRFIAYAGSVAVQVAIPWDALCALLAVWSMGVFLARLLVFQTALREPLVGRVSMESKKAGRWRRVQQVCAAALSCLLCSSIIFTVMELYKPVVVLGQRKTLPAYEIESKNFFVWPYEPEKGVTHFIRPDTMDELGDVLCVTRTSAQCQLQASLAFDGMEDNAFVRQVIDTYNSCGKSSMLSFMYRMAIQEDTLGVWVIALPERNWKENFNTKAPGFDEDAFRNGEQVVILCPTDENGKYFCERYSLQNSELQRELIFGNDLGVRAGDDITLEMYGYLTSQGSTWMGTANSRMPMKEDGELLKRIEVSVGSVQAAPADPFAGRAWGISASHPYTVLCSDAFAQKLLDGVEPARMIHSYYTGFDYGYTEARVYTSINAGLITDKAVAALTSKNRLSLSSHREEVVAGLRETIQTIILLAAGGGCAALVLLLILSSTLSLEAQREQRKYGILQSLGMSERAMSWRLVKTGLLRGLLGAAVGWLLFSGYTLMAAQGYLAEQAALEVPAVSTLSEAVSGLLWALPKGTAGALFAALLTAAVVVLLLVLTLFAKRGLFRDDLMEKLRDEQ